MTLVPGQVYRRRDLHAEYGGQRQGGISTPQAHSMVLLFTGESGHKYGYSDGPHPDGTFWYTGEGQVGNMHFVRGNAAIRDHAKTGRVLHLFEQVERGFVRYVGEATYIGHHEETAPDRDGRARKVIVFELALDARGSGTPRAKLQDQPPREPAQLWRKSLAELRTLALTKAAPDATPKERKTNTYLRSQTVRIYVLRRANGTCEGCMQPAPFVTPAGQPYLEPHHITRRADGGPDHVRWVAAICPNCHKRVHYGKDGEKFNEELAARVGRLEGA